MKLALFLIFFLTPSALAESYRPQIYFGTTSLAAMSEGFPCEANLEALEAAERPSIQVLYGTFGTSFECLRKFNEKFKDRPRAIQIAYSNEARRRQSLLGAGDFLPRDTVSRFNRRLEAMRPGFRRKVTRRIQDVLSPLLELEHQEGLTIRISLGLEDNYSCRAFSKLMDVAESVIPSHVHIVRNPLHPPHDCPDQRAYLELHNAKPGSDSEDTASPDGLVLSDADQLKWVLDAALHDVVFIHAWKPKWQGVNPRRFIPYDLRTFRIPPKDRRLIRTLATRLALIQCNTESTGEPYEIDCSFPPEAYSSPAF